VLVAQKEVAVAPVAVAHVDDVLGDLERRRAEPFADLPVRGVEVIAAGVLADVLACHGREAPDEGIGKRPFEVRLLVGEHLERHVQEAGRP
jgi:hypothetical protein